MRTSTIGLGVCVAMLLTFGTSEASFDRMATTVSLQFGADLASVDTARARGLVLPYGTFWVGSWTQRYGWGYAEQQLRLAAARNVVPVIHWWYWGDDISPACVEQGCYDARQNVRKDKATWYRMSHELAALIQRTLGGRPAAVILESEFNKGGIETYEPFDGYLAEHAAIFRSHGVTVIVGLGNWGHAHWTRFDRATAAADLLGLQLLRSSVRDAGGYAAAVDSLVSGARHLQATFGKPSVVTDLALSSYPSAQYESMQASVLDQIFERSGELKAAGVRGVLYRMIVDDPSFDPSNYHGEAERHWGLLRADGSAKPSFARMVAGIQRESAPLSPTCESPAAPGGFSVTTSGRLVTLQWAAASGATSYILEAGSAPGLSNLAVAEIARPPVSASAPPGTYYVRIRARNACGVSAPSVEQVVRLTP